MPLLFSQVPTLHQLPVLLKKPPALLCAITGPLLALVTSLSGVYDTVVLVPSLPSVTQEAPTSHFIIYEV